MAKNMRLQSFLINLGSTMLPRGESENGSVADMIYRVREQSGTLNKLVVRVSDDHEVCADCGFQFEINGKNKFYPMHVSSENKVGGFSTVAIGAKAFGVTVDPVTLSNLGVGQYHVTKDGIKKTK